MARKIHVVINPASGQPQPILHTLNQVFREAKVDWDISLTKQSGDAERFARQAAESGADIVAAYGGDGTVMEVARGLVGSPVPMAILPGGTANLMSVELGIPKDLKKAAEIACSESSQVRRVDAGKVGDTFFLLRVGLGFAARKVELADRKLKDKYGVLAYSIGAMKALTQSRPIKFKLELDGKRYEVEGISCLVDNAGNMGVSGLSPGRNISVSDGLLDVVMIVNPGFSSLVDAGKKLVEGGAMDSYVHWQAKDITIEADPPQSVQIDGEMAGTTPVTIRVDPLILRILVASNPV